MATRHQRFSPLLRVIAAVTLVFWVASVTACTTHCLCADSDTEHMEQTTMADSHPTAPDKDCDHDDNSFCLALHSLTPFFHVAVLEKPDFALAFNLDFISTALPVESPVGTFVLRQPPDREFVFTPEVSLGAAFRSLAPPVLA